MGGIALEHRVLLGELPREFRSPNGSPVDPEEGKGTQVTCKGWRSMALSQKS